MTEKEKRLIDLIRQSKDSSAMMKTVKEILSAQLPTPAELRPAMPLEQI